MNGNGDAGDHETPSAACELAAIGDSGVSGYATFTRRGEAILITVDLSGLRPGLHGIHVHEHGACSDNGKDAGGHFNPTAQEHGKGMTMDGHAGDLGNIEADSDGKAHMAVEDRYLALDGADSVVGLSLVVHADPDDFATQPSGNSGARIACGVIHRTTP